MLFWIIPIVVSYAVFVFVAEHVNPFRKFREVTARRRISAGRKAGLITLPICLALGFGANVALGKITAHKNGQLAAVKRIPSAEVLGNTDIASVTHENVKVAEVGTESSLTDTSSNQELQVTPSAAPSNLTDSTNSIAWIKAQKPRSYTIQLNASPDLASVELFLEQSQLPEPNAIFPFKRNGKTWYGLVHGLYKSSSNAEAAISTLPQPAQFHGPWVRRFEKLNEIVLTPN